MAKKLTFEEASQRFSNRTDIKLVEFVAWTRKAKFYDYVVKDYFWAKPDNVYYNGSKHPLRKNEKSTGNFLPFQEAIKRFESRDDIELVEYNGWTHKAKFYDRVVKDYFIETPDRVLHNKTKHPLRSKKKKPIQEKEAFQRFSNRTDIKLVEYNGWSNKAKFYDHVVKDYFWAIPSVVHKRNSGHPRRNNGEIIDLETAQSRLYEKGRVKIVEYNGWGKKATLLDENIGKLFHHVPSTIYRTNACYHPSLSKHIKPRNTNIRITFQEAAKRFESRDDIELCEDGYVTWTRKAKFYDHVVKDYFWAVPDSVFYGNYRGHPDRKSKNTKYFISKTNMSVNKWLETQPEPKPPYSSVQQLLRKDGLFEVTEDYLKELIQNYKSSKTQLEVRGEELFGTKHYNKSVGDIPNKRPDFKLSDLVYVNVDGLYWHCDKMKPKNYHFELRKLFEMANLRLFQFREDEIRDKPEIVKSIVNNALGQTQFKHHARKCTIKTVDHKTAKQFLINNHLQGSTSAKHIGLYTNTSNELVSVLSYKKIGNTIKIERFCNKINNTVVGGYSKLENRLIKDFGANVEEIHYWVDLRYGTGTHLQSKGYELKKETQGWKWTDYHNTFNRLQCRANMDERKLTEKEYALEKKWTKIYDAGQRLWVKRLV